MFFEKAVGLGDITLALLERRHAPKLFELVDKNRARLRLWLSWVDSTKEVSDSSNYIIKCRQGFADETDLCCGIFYLDALAGYVSLMNIRDYGAEIGYWITADYEGKGIITASADVLINYGRHLGLKQIALQCRSDNKRGEAVAKRLKFQQTRILRKAFCLDGKLYDVKLFCLIIPEDR